MFPHVHGSGLMPFSPWFMDDGACPRFRSGLLAQQYFNHLFSEIHVTDKDIYQPASATRILFLRLFIFLVAGPLLTFERPNASVGIYKS